MLYPALRGAPALNPWLVNNANEQLRPTQRPLQARTNSSKVSQKPRLLLIHCAFRGGKDSRRMSLEALQLTQRAALLATQRGQAVLLPKIKDALSSIHL